MLVSPHSPRPLAIGIDTGGTYTDAVIVDAGAHRVLASAKALTTKGDLAIGVGKALESILRKTAGTTGASEIGLVTVSTTLATNAVVEGHSDDVGVVLVGFDDAMAERTRIAASFPRSPLFRIDGGHDHNGDERSPLDETLLRSCVEATGSSVKSFAVSSSFAVRNPAHERRVAEIIAAMIDVPVTMSSDLTSALDAPRRALTAVLNAQLVSKISALIDAVSKSMAAVGIDAPLMLVKGDGSRALAATVRHRPIETVLSGPAASLIGASWLTGEQDFLMADVGGTTTDVALLRDGRPLLVEHGAEVGGWRTMVRAIDIRTTGLGGDSAVSFDGKRVMLGPQRVVPLSLLASQHPEVIDHLRADLSDSRNSNSTHAQFVLLPFGTTATSAVSDPVERQILERLGTTPSPLRKVSGSPRTQRAIESLRRRGLVQVSGFTPSDAAHVLGLQSNWVNDAALLGARIGARFRLMKEPTDADAEHFAADVCEEMTRRSVLAVIEVAAHDPEAGSSVVYQAIASESPRRGNLNHTVTLDMAVVGVGGPAPVFYPETARRVGARLILPPFGEVANAVGAATGVVTRTVEATVTGDGTGAFRAHGPRETRVFHDVALALAWATDEARHCAVDAVEAMGAPAPSTTHTVDKVLIPGFTTDIGLLSATITIVATGWPRP